MLSKLLSNITQKDGVSLKDGMKDNKEGGLKASQHIFQSLLQSLQSDDASSKKQQIIVVEGDGEGDRNADERESSSADVLGDTFLSVGKNSGHGEKHQTQKIAAQLDDKHKTKKNDETPSQNDVGQLKTEVSESDSSGQAITETKSSERPKETTSNKSEDRQVKEAKDTSKESENDIALAVNTGVVKPQKSENTSELENVKSTDEVPSGEKGNPIEVKDHQISEKTAQVVNKKDSEPNKEATVDTKQHSEKQIQAQDAVKEIQKEDQKVNSEQAEAEPRRVKVGPAKAKKMIHNLDPKPKIAPFQHSLSKANNGEKITVKDSLAKEQLRSKKVESSVKITNETEKRASGRFSPQTTSAKMSFKGQEIETGLQKKNPKKSVRDKKQRVGSVEHTHNKRNQFLNRLGINNTRNQKKIQPVNGQGFSVLKADQPDMSLEEQKKIWEKQVSESVPFSDDKQTKSINASESMKLGRIPLTNMNLRRKILSGLSKSLKKAATSAQKNPGDWQKHTFKLDGDKNIHLSVRESKGILHVKMGSLNLDLSKLLQQNLQQIRHHLKEEFGTEINLQFEGQGQQQNQHENSQSSTSRRSNYRSGMSGNNNIASENLVGTPDQSIRNFGYNKMEWTA